MLTVLVGNYKRRYAALLNAGNHAESFQAVSVTICHHADLLMHFVTVNMQVAVKFHGGRCSCFDLNRFHFRDLDLLPNLIATVNTDFLHLARVIGNGNKRNDYGTVFIAGLYREGNVLITVKAAIRACSEIQRNV